MTTFDLTAARVNAGYSRKGLARRLGVHEHSIRKLEQGHSVHPETAKKVADFFKVQVTDIMPLREAA